MLRKNIIWNVSLIYQQNLSGSLNVYRLTVNSVYCVKWVSNERMPTNWSIFVISTCQLDANQRFISFHEPLKGTRNKKWEIFIFVNVNLEVWDLFYTTDIWWKVYRESFGEQRFCVENEKFTCLNTFRDS